MINLAAAKEVIIYGAHQIWIQGVKYSPQIFTGIGIGTGVGATVVGCQASRKLDGILDEANEDIQSVRDSVEAYDDQEYKYYLFQAYLRKYKELGKLYLPTALLSLISISAIVGSHVILNGRNIALASAYKLMDESYKAYRKRVVEKYGDDDERLIRYNGVREFETETLVDEEGNKKKVKTPIDTYSPPADSDYTRVFDELNVHWEDNADQNKFFLQSQEKFANQLLNARGYIFLNEVYQALGFNPVPHGQIVGWAKDKRKKRDDVISFGVLDITTRAKRDFINGHNPSILLTFNVDGEIWRLI